MNSVPPPVKCSGPVRDFIMRVRTAPLEVRLYPVWSMLFIKVYKHKNCQINICYVFKLLDYKLWGKLIKNLRYVFLSLSNKAFSTHFF